MPSFTISRAGVDLLEEALEIVTEYFEAVDVVVREDRTSFADYYFSEGSGVWLAHTGLETVGCIALRPVVLTGPAAENHPAEAGACGEIKRLYVRPPWRGQGLADALLDALEAYARARGYGWLYLDSKDDLDAALRSYRRRGYQPCARYNDNPQATVFLRRQLTAP